MLLGKKKEKSSETSPEVDPTTDDRSFDAEVFRQIARNVYNTTPIMRKHPYDKFARLAIAIEEIRPMNHDYGKHYSKKQLLVLRELLQTEISAIEQGLIGST